MTKEEIAQMMVIGAWAARFPPILTVDQVAELLRIPKATVYAWSSEQKFRGCSRRLGKHLRFLRDRLILKVFNDGL